VQPDEAPAGLRALLASVVSIRIAVPAALVEIVVGALAGNIPGIQQHVAQPVFVTFLASAGSLVLTFLAGAEIDPVSLRGHWKASLNPVHRAGHRGDPFRFRAHPDRPAAVPAGDRGHRGMTELAVSGSGSADGLGRHLTQPGPQGRARGALCLGLDDPQA
jgi:hypothetical protein